MSQSIPPSQPPTPPVLPRSHRYRHPFSRVYQFEIALNDIEPRIWRRIQVPDLYSFWDLHCAITDCLGWLDYHLHVFKIKQPRSGKVHSIGIPDDEGMLGDKPDLPGWGKMIALYFKKPGDSCQYDYDFGDGWRHTVTLEAILPKEKGVVYPRCIAGERACPPEDCGGPGGYERFLQAIKYMNAVDHDELLAWAGGWFDPDWFDISLIRFANPELRWSLSIGGRPWPKKGLRMVQYHRMHGQ
jgi:hypothetical protein